MTCKLRSCIFAFAAVLSLGLGEAQAQSRWPNTQSVNECTQLNDPDSTRRCIEAYQGLRTDPISPTQQTTPLPLPTPTPAQPANPPRRVAPPPGR